MLSLGLEGYMNNTREIMEASKKIEKGIKETPELFVVGRPPDMTIFAFGSNVLDIFEVNDQLEDGIEHVPVVERFLMDLKESVNTVKQNPGPINGGLAPIYGAAGKLPDRGMVSELLVSYLDGTC